MVPSVALGCTLIAASPALAQTGESAVNEKLLSLQEQIDELTTRLETTPATGSDRATMKVFGRLHIDNWTHSTSDDAINFFETDDPSTDIQNRTLFRRARLGVSGDVNDSMGYKLELDFGLPSALAFKDMFMSFKNIFGKQRLQIGNQKRPYGLDHLNSSRFNVFIERPFIVEAFNEDARRFGAVTYGQSDDKNWNWTYGGYHMENFAGSGQISGDTFQPEFAGRIAHTPRYRNDGRDYVHLAVAGTVAFPDGDPRNGENANLARFRTRPEGRTNSRWLNTGRIDGTDSYQVAAVEAVWNQGPTQVVGEYMSSWLSRSDANDLQFNGGYLQVAHFLTGEYMPWSRKSGTVGRPKPSKNFAPKIGSGAWQLAARYSVADLSNENIRGGRGESLTLGLNWYFNPNASLQFNYIRGEITERDDVVGGQLFDGGDYEVLGIRMRIDF